MAFDHHPVRQRTWQLRGIHFVKKVVHEQQLQLEKLTPSFRSIIVIMPMYSPPYDYGHSLNPSLISSVRTRLLIKRPDSAMLYYHLFTTRNPAPSILAFPLAQQKYTSHYFLPRPINIRHLNILKAYSIARLNLRTTNTTRRVAHRARIARDIDEGDIANLHRTRTCIATIIAVIRRDGRPRCSALHAEVGEQQVCDGAPATATRLIAGLIARLRDEGADPGFYVGAVVEVFVVEYRLKES